MEIDGNLVSLFLMCDARISGGVGWESIGAKEVEFFLGHRLQRDLISRRLYN